MINPPGPSLGLVIHTTGYCTSLLEYGSLRSSSCYSCRHECRVASLLDLLVAISQTANRDPRDPIYSRCRSHSTGSTRFHVFTLHAPTSFVHKEGPESPQIPTLPASTSATWSISVLGLMIATALLTLLSMCSTWPQCDSISASPSTWSAPSRPAGEGLWGLRMCASLSVWSALTPPGVRRTPALVMSFSPNASRNCASASAQSVAR